MFEVPNTFALPEKSVKEIKDGDREANANDKTNKFKKSNELLRVNLFKRYPENFNVDKDAAHLFAFFSIFHLHFDKYHHR